METLVIHPENKDQLKALKFFLKALKVSFESTKDSPYNKEFVEKIKKSRKQLDKGQGRNVSLDEIWK